jgi:hypothetical protein
MGKTVGIIIVLLVIAGGIYFYMNNANNPASNMNGAQSGTSGRVVFSVTDAAADMKTISEVTLNVSSVSMHSTAQGWVTASTTPRSYDLLALKASGEADVLADTQVATGTYDQVRLAVSSVKVKSKTGATTEAKLPSGELKIMTKVVVASGNTASVHLDFLADKSLHATGNGGYIFAPVVKTDSKSSANVSVAASGAVSISGGHTDDSSSSGMDIDGSVKANFELNQSQNFEIGPDNFIRVKGVIGK